MDQLLGLYTSPNSLQLPPGATLKAENVYLDTDGYFKPFKKIERAFSYADLLQSFVTPLSIWGEAVNLKFFSVKGRLLALAVDANHQILGYFAPDQNGVFQEISNPEYAQVAKETFDYLASTSNVFYPSVEYGKFLLLGLVSGLPSLFGQSGVTCFYLDETIQALNTSCPPPDVFAATYTLPTSRVYDGDPANNPTNAVRECLISIASPGVVTLANHNIEPDTAIQFQTTEALPTGIVAGDTYYVLATGITTNTFRFSSSIGGAAVNTSGTQSGIQSVISTDADQLYANAYRFTLSGKIGAQLVESKPTGSIYVRGRNGVLPPSVWIGLVDLAIRTIKDNASFLSNAQLNIYRTVLEFASLAGVTPRESEDFRLVQNQNVSAQEILEYAYSDQPVMPPGSSELYTNTTRDGIIKQNEQNYGHLCSSLYKGYAFYGNTTNRPFVILDLKIPENETSSPFITGHWWIQTSKNDEPLAGYRPVRYFLAYNDPSADTNFTTGAFYSISEFQNGTYLYELDGFDPKIKIIITSHGYEEGQFVYVNFKTGEQTSKKQECAATVEIIDADSFYVVFEFMVGGSSGDVEVATLIGLAYEHPKELYVTHLNTSGTGAKMIIQSKKIGEYMKFRQSCIFQRTGTYELGGSPGTVRINVESHGMEAPPEPNYPLYIEFTSGSLTEQSKWFEDKTVINADSFDLSGLDLTDFASGDCVYYGLFGPFAEPTDPMASNIEFTRDPIDGTFQGYALDAEPANSPSILYYSKFQQPYSLTLDQNFPVGSDGEILYLANLREYLLIFKTDGVYILRGETEEEFTIDPLYPQLQLLDSQAIQIIDDYVVGLFSIGVVRLNENGYEIISQPIRDDIQYMIDAVTPEGVVIEEPPIVFYQKSKRLVYVGRKKFLVKAADNEDLPYEYLAHDAFVYHLDSKQWTKSTKINLDGAVEIDGEIYFPGIPNAPTEIEVSPGVDYTFTTDIFKTSSSLLPTAYTTDFAIRFVKKLQTPDGKSGNYRYLKIHFREMNLTSIKVRYYLNYNFENGDDFFEETYDDIVTFEEDGSIASSRYMCYLYIPTEAARGNWLSFEIFGATNSGVDLRRYNGILVEGVELVTSPGRSDTV